MADPLVEYIYVPKVLFTDLEYRWMSSFSKILYAVLLDQSRLAIKKGWVDKNNNIYVVFPKSELRNYLKVSRSKLDAGFYELEECAKLIKVVYPKPGMAGRIYLRNIVSANEKR